MLGPRDVDNIGLLFMVVGYSSEEYLLVVGAKLHEGLLLVDVNHMDAILLLTLQ